MFAINGRLKVSVLVVTAVFVGAFFFTVMVFAGGDTSPHNKSNSHYHRTPSEADDVQWSVAVGKIGWNSVSTYCWHKVTARNNKGNWASGDWEWKHHVRNKKNTWQKTDKIWKRDVTLKASESLSRSGWTSVDLPSGGADSRYRIEAYTRIDLIKNRVNITGGAGKRSIVSVWFRKG